MGIKAHGELSHALLRQKLNAHTQAVDTMLEEANPSELSALIELYAELGQSVSTSEACLVAVFDALDSRVGDGVAPDAEGYEQVKRQAFDLLRHSGVMFARLGAPFSTLVHGGGGWPNQPVDHSGRTLYRNTFKKNYALSPEQRTQEYNQRVNTFVDGGGSFDDIQLLDAQTIRGLKPWAHYDYVMLPNLETRVYPTSPEDRGDKPKAGHSLLIGVGSQFKDHLVLSAGEMWILKDHAGDLETVVIASNSGHFKPDFSVLPHTIPGLNHLDINESQVALFGGPNNIKSIFGEIEHLHKVDGLSARRPPNPADLLEQWSGS